MTDIVVISSPQFWISHMRSEFYQLETQRNSMYNNADVQSSNTMNKNRYRGILPIEETRVKLSTIDDLDGSDYINANFVSCDIEEQDRSYIACQAPLDSTITDFWRMIWEHKCGVIVMLTSLVEDGMVKSACYWPDEGKVIKYGNLLVCHKKSFIIGDIIVRSLLVKDTTSDDRKSVREIIQIHYEKWPDFGVPNTTKPVRDIMVLMSKFKERATNCYELDGPVVVHCSAGVGRTGALIASHIAITKHKRGDLVNIKQIVESMRKQRHYTMVKNEIQYMYIYDVLKDALRDKNFQK